MRELNWRDTNITYEDIIYDGLLTYSSYEDIPSEVIIFVGSVFAKKDGENSIVEDYIQDLKEYLKEKYEEREE